MNELTRINSSAIGCQQQGSIYIMLLFFNYIRSKTMNIKPSKYLQHETYSQMEKRLKRRDNILTAIAILLPVAFIFFFNLYLINL
jgi:hypothetical protein